MKKNIKVKKKSSGLIYTLWPRADIDKDCYYLSCNDGMVPSGQTAHFTDKEIKELFDVIND